MIRGEATVKLKDGRSLTLAMGFRALALATAETRIPAGEIFDVLKKDDGRQTLAVLGLIGGALKKYHREIGPDDLDLIMLDNTELMSETLSTIMNGAFSDPEDDEQEKGSEGNDPDGTGTNSKETGQKQA